MTAPAPSGTRQEDPARDDDTRDDARDRLEHDVRQSLCAMSAMLDVIRQDPLGQPEVLHRLELIRRESDWMARVLDDTSSPEATLVDTGEVVEATWRMVAGEATSPVRLVREPVPPTVADPVRLGRAVRNLLDNAVRASDGGAVEVRVHSRGTRVVVEVADSGPGFGRIPRQHGHGLVTARQVMAQVGGRLTIGDDGDGLGGARVCLELPMTLERTALVEAAM
ncbi:MAG TPA: HAMP domain-containing sensor histidine kinase [Marmoricola sp.]|nr:HAMP domain-containing sensor histidine kinase [Marmoricola sp.]